MALDKDDTAWIDSQIRERVDHIASSPETKKSLHNLYEKMDGLKAKQIKNGEEIAFVKQTAGRIEAKLDKFIDAADKKFAPKWASDVLKWAGKIGGGVILLALLSEIVKG